MSLTNPDWIPPIEATFDPDKPIRSEQGIMLAGNPIAARQAKTGAPVEATGWHGFGQTAIGTGSGLVYNGATVSTVTIGAVQAGYEYRIACNGIARDTTSDITADLLLELRIGGTWVSVGSIARLSLAGSGGDPVTYYRASTDGVVGFAGASRRGYIYSGSYAYTSDNISIPPNFPDGALTTENIIRAVGVATPATPTDIRLRMSAGNLGAGSIRVYQRLVVGV